MFRNVLWRIVNSHALRFVPVSNWWAERNAFKYVSWTRSSASGARRVSRSAVPYRLSIWDSAACANSVSDRPPGQRQRTAGRAAESMPISARRPGRTPAAGGFIPSLYRGEDTAAPAGGQSGAGPGRAPPPGHLCRRARGLLRRAAGVSRPGDLSVAANVLVTVTSAPFEVETCVRAPGAGYARRSASPSSCSCSSRARLPRARRRPSCRTTTRTGSSSTTSSGTPTPTDHFEIYYYPEIEQHLERIASYAESAYQKVSADLKHDLAFKVPMILYKTASEFQQQNIEPGELPEGVLAFAEPYRDRMVLPIDEPSDALYRLITHELTHIFEFDIIPRTLLRRGLPLWVDEGLADYETGYWNPFDLMTVRDAAIADIVPPMSDFQGAAVRGRPPALQPRSRGVRVHRVEVGQGRTAAVPLRAAQERHRRRRQRLRGSVQAEARRVRRAVRQVPEGPLQAVPRQGAAAGLRPRPRARSAAGRSTSRSSRSSRPPRAT